MDLDEMPIPVEEPDEVVEEDDDDDDSSGEDLYNALGLLQDNLTFLEGILKDDLTNKFLRSSDRTALMDHCGELMTFLDQFENENC